MTLGGYICLQYGISRSPYADKRITHKPGWMIVLVSGECYEMDFENAGHISNVSYDGAYYQFDVSHNNNNNNNNNTTTTNNNNR